MNIEKNMSTPALLIQLYEEQVKFLQGQIKQLKEHAASHFVEVVPGPKKNDNKKKRALSAYQLFMKERLKSGGSDPKASLTLVSKEWNNLDQTAKQPYVELAKKFNDENVAKVIAPAAPKESKKRKAPATESVAAVPVPVNPVPVPAPKATIAPVVPPTPAPVVPPTPSTNAGDEEKSSKKKKKKHHKDGEKKVWFLMISPVIKLLT